MAIAGATLFLAPWLWVVATPVSLLVSQHEFIGYRFPTSLSVLFGETRRVGIVQGVSMGILQHVIVAVLARVLHRPSTDISTLPQNENPGELRIAEECHGVTLS